MYRNKFITTSLAVLAVATAISLVTASTSGGLVISAFAAKKVLNQVARVVVKNVHLVEAVPAQVLKLSLSNVLQHYPEVFQGLR